MSKKKYNDYPLRPCEKCKHLEDDYSYGVPWCCAGAYPYARRPCDRFEAQKGGEGADG